MPKVEDYKGKEGGNPFDILPYDGGEVPESYVPEGFDSQEEFLDDMRETYADDLAFDDFNRVEALEDKKFSAGEQWDPIVLEHREGLPCLTIDTVPQFLAQVAGDWREQRPGVKVVPDEDGDTDIAEIRGDLVRAIEQTSNADRVYINGFESMIQCGDGAWRVAVRYARNNVFDQNICIEPIDDCLSVVWDRFSIDPTGADATRVFVDDLLPEKEFNRKWPDKDPSNLGPKMVNTLASGGWFEKNAGVRVTEYWRMLERERLLVLFEDGHITFVDEGEDPDMLIQQHGPPIKSRIAPCSYAQMHLVTGHAILSGPYEYKLSRLPIIRCTGRVVNVAGRRIRSGIVRPMKDSVRLRNFWRSKNAEMLGYSSNAQIWATEEAVAGHEEDIRNAHINRDPLTIFSDEAQFGRNVIRNEPPQIQSALIQASQEAAQDLKDVTGIHEASLGIRSNEVSGKAIRAREEQGSVANKNFYDNGNYAVVETGKVTNELISQIYDGTRTIRRIGEDQSIKFQRINDPMDPESPNLALGHYDIAMVSGPSYSSRRVEAAEAMMGAIQVWPELMQIAGDLVVKAQNWPGAEDLAERIKRTIPPHFLDPEDEDAQGGRLPSMEEIQGMQQQLQGLSQELQERMQEIETLKSDKALEGRKLDIDEYNAETNRAKVLLDKDTKEEELRAKAAADLSNDPDITTQD